MNDYQFGVITTMMSNIENYLRLMNDRMNEIETILDALGKKEN